MVNPAAESPNPRMMGQVLVLLNNLKRNGIEPNFWCAPEYIEAAGWKVLFDKDRFIRVRDGEGVLMFPPIPSRPDIPLPTHTPEPYWADFAGYSPTSGLHMRELDLEYTYNPIHFLKMEGGEWSVFRKNSRKWPRRQGESFPENVQLKTLNPYAYSAKVQALLVRWLEGRSEAETIHDDETLLTLIHSSTRRAGIWREKELLGIVVWEELLDRVIFRYCITDPAEPFLNEYLRSQFYNYLTPKYKLVNDGGVLGNPHLKAFKDKLNPVRVRTVYTTLPPTEEEA